MTADYPGLGVGHQPLASNTADWEKKVRHCSAARDCKRARLLASTGHPTRLRAWPWKTSKTSKFVLFELRPCDLDVQGTWSMGASLGQ
jgi:hypothetical protein